MCQMMSGEYSSCGVCVRLYTRVRISDEDSFRGVCVHVHTHIKMSGECSSHGVCGVCVPVCTRVRGGQASASVTFHLTPLRPETGSLPEPGAPVALLSPLPTALGSQEPHGHAFYVGSKFRSSAIS